MHHKQHYCQLTHFQFHATQRPACATREKWRRVVYSKRDAYSRTHQKFRFLNLRVTIYETDGSDLIGN